MPIIDKFRYRPEIDGLRAIAVLAVVLYHFGFSFTGGYVGVDIFFVISGFLITSLIWKDLESGRFTFANFWERRARRIVPALVVVTLATLLGGWFVLMPEDFAKLGRAAASQVVFAANINYFLDSGYFGGESIEKPLLHTWSLAVEEQFYLIAPFVFWGMFRVAALRTRKAVLTVISACFLLSLALSIYGVSRNPSAAFYLLPTRAWELLLGSLVAFLPHDSALLKSRGLREFASLVSLALVAAPFFLYTSETSFPGITAVPPCLGAGLLIWANTPGDESVKTFVGKFLSLRPVVFIGLISYSLYLWHWPVLVYGKFLALGINSLSLNLAMLALGFLLAVLSWKFVETPFRERKIGGTRKSVFAFAGAGLAAVLAVGLLCIKTHGFPQRLSPQAQRFANAKFDMSFMDERSTEQVRAGNLVRLGKTDPKLRPVVLVWGDSHARSALPAVDAFLKEKGLAGCAATRTATAPLLGWGHSKTQFHGLGAIAFNDAVFAYIQKNRIPNVILGCLWNVNRPPSFSVALLKTVQRLNSIGCRPWILLDVPYHTFNAPMALALPYYSDAYIASICTKPKPRDEIETTDPNLIAKIEASGGRILNPKPSFLDPTKQHYVVKANDVVLYRDRGT